MKIKDPTIALDKYSNVNHITRKISWEQWVAALGQHNDYFVWSEDTEEGKKTLADLNSFPEYLREGMVQQFKKRKAYAEYNPNKKRYEIILQYSDKFGLIHSTFMKPFKNNHLTILLSIADCLNGYLLNYGNVIIDSSFLSERKAGDD